jgi:hypothetical protein
MVIMYSLKYPTFALSIDPSSKIWHMRFEYLPHIGTIQKKNLKILKNFSKVSKNNIKNTSFYLSICKKKFKFF